MILCLFIMVHVICIVCLQVDLERGICTAHLLLSAQGKNINKGRAGLCPVLGGNVMIRDMKKYFLTRKTVACF